MVVCNVGKSLLVPLFLFAWIHVNGQAVDLSMPIRLKAAITSLDSGLRATSQQVGVVFSYNSKKLNTKQAINFGLVTTLAQFLSQLEKTGVKIKIIENYIVLSPQAATKLPIKEVTNDRTLRTTDVSYLPDTATSVSEKKPVTEKESGILSETIPQETILQKIHMDSLPLVRGLAPLHEPMVKGLAAGPTLNGMRRIFKAPELKPKISNAPKSPSYFGRYGLSVDETTPLGLAAQVGLPYLFGSISLNTSFESSQFRYGLGSSARIKKSTRLILLFSWGSVGRSGQFTDSTATVYPIEVKSKLSRLTAAVEFTITKKLKIQAGPMFNYLQTKYFINSHVSSLQLFKSEGDNLFYAIKPPYVMTNTFSSTTDSNLKTWIGFQVNLFYTLNF